MNTEIVVEEYGLSADEVMMFEKIAMMEAVHNELGSNLSAYKDSIVEFRNQFVSSLAAKHRWERPGQLTFDPIKKRVVSVFHPELKGHKIEARPYAFKDIASVLTRDLIKKLMDVLKVQRGG